MDSKESILLAYEARARICKRLGSPGINFEEFFRQIGLPYRPAMLGIDS
jgi:hypothetical protein